MPEPASASDRPQRRLSTLLVEVTRRCNHSCAHCYNVWRGSVPDVEPRELGTRAFIELLDDVLGQVTCSQVTLTGGEPLLRDDLEVIVGHLADKGLRINLVTNGSLLTPGRLERLVEAGLGLVELPVLSADADQHDALSGHTGAFRAVTSAMAHAQRLRIPFVPVFVAMAENASQAEGVFELVAALGATTVMVNRYNATRADRATKQETLATTRELEGAPLTGKQGEALSIKEQSWPPLTGKQGEALSIKEQEKGSAPPRVPTAAQLEGASASPRIPTVAQLEAVFEAAERCAIAFGVSFASSVPIPPCVLDMSRFPHVGTGRCAVGTDRAYYTIDPSGRLRPCNHSPTVLGDLTTASLESLLQSEAFRAFCDAHPPQCSDCSEVVTCQGGCKAAAEQCYQRLDALDPFLQANAPVSAILVGPRSLNRPR